MQLHYYSYENNGNIRDLTRGIRATAGADPAYLQSWFDYDGLNRLKEFQFSDGLSQLLVPLDGGPDPLLAHQYEYVIDRFGNVTRRNYSGSGGTGIPGSLNLPVDTATNRLSGGSYDGLGNQVQIEQNGTTLNLNYLDQGHVWEVRDVSDNLQYRYYYDADGKRRIKAKASDGLTNFQEDASYYFYDGESLSCQLDIGELVQEEEETYQPKFLMLDHLGSTRAEIIFAGAGLTPTVSSRYDYMPYGQFINVPFEAPEQVCFTGKPRDPESGLDNFGPRGLNSNLCRWMSPDQLFADNQPENPQSWNLYGYVRNTPLIALDKNGQKTEIDILLHKSEESFGASVGLFYHEILTAGEVSLTDATLKNLVDTVLSEAGGDKIQDLEIAGHGGITGIDLGDAITTPLTSDPTINALSSSQTAELGRLEGHFAENGMVTIKQCGEKGASADSNFVQERTGILQSISNTLGVAVRAPSGGFNSLTQTNVRGDWIVVQPQKAASTPSGTTPAPSPPPPEEQR